MRLKFSLRKILSVIATLATLANSMVVPATVLAQEITPSPTPTPTETASPAPTETASPTPDATVAPTESPTAEPSATPTIVATPSASVTPTPTDVTTPAPESQTTQDETQTTNGSAQPEAPPAETTTPTPTVTPVQPEPEGSLTTTVAQNVDLSQIDLLNSNVDTATVTTDKADYSPTDVVLITGTGFTPEKAYTIEIVSTDPPPVDFTDSVQADPQGSFIYSYQLDGNYRPNYTIYVKDGDFTVASTTFTDAPPSANLDQCANGSALFPTDPCSWQNGNLNSNQAHYVEGQSVPYRVVMANLPGDGSTAITITLGYDIKHSSADALDYLTYYDRLEPHSPFGHPAETVTPTAGISGVSATTTTFAIPAPSSSGSPVAGQPTNSFNSLPAGEKLMTLFGGTITNITYGTQGDLTAAQAETTINVTFTTNSSNAVLSWGGHIASRLDWGDGNSAGGISGSPYHMRLKDWTLNNLGNQDRSLQAGAVIPPGNLTIIKDVIPDDSGATSWDFLTTGPNSYSHDTTGLIDGGIDVLSVPPGTYNISELTDPNYSTTVLCTTGESGTSSVAVTVGSNENVSCTFTNTLQKAHLTLVKEVTKDNGGTALPTAWTLSASGPTPISGSTGDPSITNAEVTNGTYSLSESSGPSGYSAGSWSCTGDGSQIGSDITLAPGDSATCTIINNDIAPQLTVIKHVINDNGGTAVASNFTMNVTATNPSQSSFAGAESPGTTITLDAGSYSVDEGSYPGYTKSIGADCSGTIALGESKTCTITNNDQQAYITVIKTVNNNHGGTALPNDFKLTLDGNAVTAGVAVPVDPGTYTAGETLLSGYSFDGFSGDCNGNGETTVALGESKTCTLTNSDQQSYVTVTKVVNNNHGGTANPDDFNLTLDGNAVTSGIAVPVDPGTYTSGESPLSGYSFDGFSGDCDRNGDVSVALGESKTCTLTNSDEQAYITVVKVVNNNNAGTAVADDFGLTLDGNAVTSGIAVPVNPGTYTAGETLLSGYSFDGFSDDCNGNGETTVALGESKTCTLTNSDQATHLIVIKHVDGGSATASDFTMTINGVTANGGGSFDGEESPGTDKTLSTLGAYTVTESGNATSDYTASYSTDCTGTISLGETKTCTVTNTRDVGSIKVNKLLDGDGNGTFETLNPGTFNWSLNGSGTNVMGQTITGINTGLYNVNENSVTDYHFVGWYYTGQEGSCDNPDGTTLPASVNVTKNSTTDVTLCNARDTGDLKVNKLQDDSGNGDYSNLNSNDFSWGTASNATNYAMGSSQTLVTGNYDVYESDVNSYKFTGWFYGDPRENEFSCLEPEYTTDPTNIAVTYDQETEITLCNQYQNPKVSITKSNDSGSGISAGNTVTYTLSITNPGNIDFYNVLVTDVLPAGFKYIDGSTAGATLILPQVNPLLKWNLGTLNAGQTKVITYQASTDSNLSDGTYTNFANCAAYFDGEGSPEPCEQVNSNVTIGSGVSFGGNLGQVLGISTELPATGSPTMLLLAALGLIGVGFVLKKKYVKN